MTGSSTARLELVCGWVFFKKIQIFDMITKDKLIELLSDLESDRVERTISGKINWGQLLAHLPMISRIIGCRVIFC